MSQEMEVHVSVSRVLKTSFNKANNLQRNYFQLTKNCECT